MSSIARLLAVLIAEDGSYTYVDKLSYAPSKDLALYYLRESLRDFHSIVNKTDWDNPRAKEEVSKIDMNEVERELQEIERVRSMKELRERVSLIAAKALSLSTGLMSGVRS